MRRVSSVGFALLFFAAASSSMSAQQSVYMTVESIKGDQPAPHVGEFKLENFSSGVENKAAIGTGTTGITVGKAAFLPVKVSMRFSPASSPLFFRSVASGTKVPSIEIRQYNSNRMYYKTVFEDAFLTNVSVQGSDEAVEEIEFAYSRVKWFTSPDASGATPPVQVGCWDVAMAKGC